MAKFSIFDNFSFENSTSEVGYREVGHKVGYREVGHKQSWSQTGMVKGQLRKPLCMAVWKFTYPLKQHFYNQN